MPEQTPLMDETLPKEARIDWLKQKAQKGEEPTDEELKVALALAHELRAENIPRKKTAKKAPKESAEDLLSLFNEQYGEGGNGNAK